MEVLVIICLRDVLKVRYRLSCDCPCGSTLKSVCQRKCFPQQSTTKSWWETVEWKESHKSTYKIYTNISSLLKVGEFVKKVTDSRQALKIKFYKYSIKNFPLSSLSGQFPHAVYWTKVVRYFMVLYGFHVLSTKAQLEAPVLNFECWIINFQLVFCKRCDDCS